MAPVLSKSDLIAAPSLSVNPDAKTNRWEIVQRADSKFFVRTSNLWNAVTVVLHDEIFDSIEQARAEVARQKAEIARKRQAAVETVVEVDEV